MHIYSSDDAARLKVDENFGPYNLAIGSALKFFGEISVLNKKARGGVDSENILDVSNQLIKTAMIGSPFGFNQNPS